MLPDYPEVARDLSRAIAELKEGIAETMQGFPAMAARRHQASREELLEVPGMVVYMGGGPSMVYAAQALAAYGQFAAGS